MELKKYTSHFHDGGVRDISVTDKGVVFTMESCQIDPKYIEDLNLLSNFGNIVGKLHIEGVKNISFESGTEADLEMHSDAGTILDFELVKSQVYFNIMWNNFGRPREPSKHTMCWIEAESIQWENLPDLIDSENPPIEFYCGHFVEGTLKDIRFEEKQIGFEDKYSELRMVLESASVTSAHKVPEWLRLTSSDTLLGSLQMIWIQCVLRDGKEVEVDAVSMVGSTALIKSLNIENHWVTLDLEWQNEDRTLAVKERMGVLAGSITWRDRLT